jgi:dolichol-phosphate mannosyltransferase
MLVRLRPGDVDLAVASRYVGAGSAAGLAGRRASYSRWSTVLARRLLHVELSDPMSGFFMLRRSAIEELAPALSSQGFKILLDIVASARGALRIAELPYVFRERQHGESKLDARTVLDFFALLLGKLSSDTVSFRFLMYCLVGLTGVVIHMAALAVVVDLAGLAFGAAQTAATVAAIVWNFALNNAVTYRDQRLAGWAFVTGLARFAVICAVGAISNVGVATWVYGYDPKWWVAGLAGALMGAAWNYIVSAAFVWRAR